MDSSPQKRASGTMSGLSTLKDLEELSISLAHQLHANPSVSQVNSDKIKMKEICSPIHSGSSVSVDPELWYLKMSPESYQLGLENAAPISSESSVSLPRSGTLISDGKSYRLRTLELPISGNDGSASPNWPTPRVSDTEGGLVHNVELKDGSFSRTNKQGVRWGVKLRDATENWSTPTEDDSSNVNPKENRRMTLVKHVNQVTKNWPTPRSIDHKNPDQPVNRRENTPPQHLSAATKNWPTPTKRDWKGSGPSVERKDGKSRMSHLDYKAELSHFGQTTDPDSLSSPHHQMTTSHGSGSSPTDQTSHLPSQKKLNPLFCEYLMGLPENWTSLKPIEYSV